MRRAAVVAILVSALVGVVGAESIIKAKSALPKGNVSVEEIETVMVEAPAIDSVVAAVNAGEQKRGTTYAMY